MSFWQFIDRLIQNPPSWIITIIFAFLVVHALKFVLEWLRKSVPGLSKYLLEILELLMVVTLVLLTLKAFYWDTLEGDALHEWYEHPLAMLAILLITTFASMIIVYIKIKRFP